MSSERLALASTSDDSTYSPQHHHNHAMNNNDDQSSFRETILLTAVMGDHTATNGDTTTAPSTAQGDSCQAIAIQPAAPRAGRPEHANNPPPPASTTSAPVPAPAAPP
eukprot:COSAG04_NODE_5467_length_1607_cov_3.001326_1_plen_107_part_10